LRLGEPGLLLAVVAAMCVLDGNSVALGLTDGVVVAANLGACREGHQNQKIAETVFMKCPLDFPRADLSRRYL